VLGIPLLFGAALLYGYFGRSGQTRKAQSGRIGGEPQTTVVDERSALSNVSHELRTPLTAVYQFVTLLLDGIPGKLNVEQKEYLEIALRNVKQLKRWSVTYWTRPASTAAS